MFAIVAFDLDYKIFVVYIAFFNSSFDTSGKVDLL